MTDSAATEILGPQCSECGWRGGQHRPAAPTMGMEACPQWVGAAGEGE